MKCLSRSIVAVASMALMLFLIACDWSSGSQNDYNTSGSDGSNLSGFYEGTLSGGLAVSNSAFGIVSFSIQQSGNRLDIIDNQASTYTGTIGQALSSASNSPSGSDEGETVQGTVTFTYQLGFTGVNRVTGREVNFSGFIEVKRESVIVGVLRDAEGNITEVIREEVTTFTLKGTWVEPGSGSYSVLAETNPPPVEPTPTPAPVAP